MKKTPGFSLIELLITLSIISILSAMALPFYAQHIANERRLEAEMTLNKLAISLEHYYTLHNSYKDATLTNLEFNDKIAHNRYQLVIVSATDSNFELQAKPLDNQARVDLACGTLTLSSSGEKGITGWGNLTECW
jgi:type IV pilus assembly protein PilE